MTYVFAYEHFDATGDRLVFQPNLNPFDYEIQPKLQKKSADH